jgi:uncharacterized small protein (DUF1192 family)
VAPVDPIAALQARIAQLQTEMVTKQMMAEQQSEMEEMTFDTMMQAEIARVTAEWANANKAAMQAAPAQPAQVATPASAQPVNVDSAPVQ